MSPLSLDSSLDMTDESLFANGVPEELFSRLRHEAPVLWTDAPEHWPASVGRGQWNVTRAADVRTVSRRWQTYSSALGGVMIDNRDAGGLDIIHETLLGKDGAEHDRQRKIVDNAFTPARVADLEGMVRRTVDRYLDDFVAAGPGDLVEGFTKQVPLNVICELLGIPEEDREQVYKWAASVVISPNDAELVALYGRPEESRRKAYDYVKDLLAQRSACPADDLATFFTTATVDGQPVPEEMRIAFFRQLFEAGAETTMNTMTLGIKALSDYPDQWRRLLEDRSLVPTAVEEMLRWSSPVVYFRRTATCDVELAGQLIREGDAVVMWYCSANRDEDVFPDAQTFDVARESNPHFAFGGGGAHFCLGASLARLELRVMLEALLDRVPDLKVAGPMTRVKSNIVSAVSHLPVTFSSSAAQA